MIETRPLEVEPTTDRLGAGRHAVGRHLIGCRQDARKARVAHTSFIHSSARWRAQQADISALLAAATISSSIACRISSEVRVAAVAIAQPQQPTMQLAEHTRRNIVTI